MSGGDVRAGVAAAPGSDAAGPRPGLVAGLVVLHGNRLEWLLDAVRGQLERRPLAPLEEEHLLVQSNGAAEWLKMSLAQGSGICAASRVELPARFLWRAYRQMLGPEAVPAASPLDAAPLVWRLMRLLPAMRRDDRFAPLADFLHGDDLERRLQLAERLADVFDQYQVHRADWLADWAAGRDVLRDAAGVEAPLPHAERWQPLLWRALLDELDASGRAAIRPEVHRRFLAAVRGGSAPHSPLPRRVVLFGASHLPGQTLEALAALAGRIQVLIAVPNPCRHHWADIIDGRELLRAERRRHAAKGGRDLAAVPLAAMHAHAHPLLAAWGRQGRDFMRRLDDFDDVERTRREHDVPRVDLFDSGDGESLLAQAQAAIRDLLPLAEHPPREASPADRSIVFHVAHGPQREVEVLHDQLLALFEATASSEAPLRPRDVVVMVPDIDVFAASIRAVFGQHPPGDARRIPFAIVDVRQRGRDRLVVALEWLLRAPAQRFRFSEVHDLLEVPAIGRRFGIDADALPTLAAWIGGAGIRWGLDAAQREALGLGAAGAQNTWSSGLARMLLGYASGEPFHGLEPCDEIGGLDAALVGALADLLGRLDAWSRECARPAPPREWARRGRALLAALVEPADEAERLTLAALEAALASWLEACEAGGFDAALPLPVFREAWLAALDPPGGGRRFLAGGVTFCTLLPLRAVPFPVVCLLGMNDGAYPRPSRRSDFDLMGLPGQQRPGDRSRRDDDRYLMLEALLSARRVLYVSWSGRSARDNSEQPPSVLVSQLRDYLRAGWPAADGGDPLAMRTTEHPLQPFSRRYFEAGAAAAGLATYAREWRSAHGRPVDAGAGSAAGAAGAASGTAIAAAAAAPTWPPFEPIAGALTVAGLASFLKNPVKAFFRDRLSVVFDRQDETVADDEPFAIDGLGRWSLLDELASADADPGDAVARILAAGRLPIGAAGTGLAAALRAEVEPMLAERARLLARYPEPSPPLLLRFDAGDAAVDDWLDGVRGDGAARVWIAMRASRMRRPSADGDGPLVAYKLIGEWVRTLVLGACGHAVAGRLVASDGTLELPPVEAGLAEVALRELIAVWREAMREPLPLAAKTALAFLAGDDPRAEYEGRWQQEDRAEVGEPCLGRVWPDFAALAADGRFAALAGRAFGPMADWLQTVRSSADA